MESTDENNPQNKASQFDNQLMGNKKQLIYHKKNREREKEVSRRLLTWKKNGARALLGSSSTAPTTTADTGSREGVFDGEEEERRSFRRDRAKESKGNGFGDRCFESQGNRISHSPSRGEGMGKRMGSGETPRGHKDEASPSPTGPLSGSDR